MRLLLGGDTMLGRKVDETVAVRGPDYPLEAIFHLTHDADLFFVNLECAITPKRLRYRGPPKAFYFRADPRAIDTLTGAGVRLVSLANNHALDADLAGLEDTVALLEAAGIASRGRGPRVRASPASSRGGGPRDRRSGCWPTAITRPTSRPRPSVRGFATSI